MPQIYLPGETEPRDCDIPDLVRWDKAVAEGKHPNREAAAAAELKPKSTAKRSAAKKNEQPASTGKDD